MYQQIPDGIRFGIERRTFMKKKGIWNHYKGSIRKELLKYCQENQIREEQFHFMNIYKWEGIYKQVVEHFVDGKERKKDLHWLNTNGIFKEDKCIQAIFDSRGHEEWSLKIPDLIEDSHTLVYYLIEDSKFWIMEGEPQIIAQLIYEEFYHYDYYIVDRKYRWMITCNHHGGVSFVGEGLRNKEIIKMIESL